LIFENLAYKKVSGKRKRREKQKTPLAQARETGSMPQHPGH
jgi:hypothetical protein